MFTVIQIEEAVLNPATGYGRIGNDMYLVEDFV